MTFSLRKYAQNASARCSIKPKMTVAHVDGFIFFSNDRLKLPRNALMRFSEINEING